MSVHAQIGAARSFLFVPASRADRFEKAHASGSDVVVLDLEDAVSAGDKSTALASVVQWLEPGRRQSVSIVRINAVNSRWHENEIDSLRRFGVPLMVPKTDSPVMVEALHRRSGLPLVPLIETPAGVFRAESIAAAEGVVRVALGHIDLAAALRVDPDSRDAFLYTRSQLVLASAGAGIAGPVDGVTTSLDDPARLIDDVMHAQAMGLTGKLCIHPRQVDLVHDVLRPSEADIAWARRVAAAVDAGWVSEGGGAVAIDGEMVDPPVISRARTILARL
ncbi:CoA ester lyase [Rhodococcus sp. 15-725-2-2b]|jgi:citrate lyase subunit beta/citryl-CoA lyase|nr:CoA ester lyase [Rhodococcus sp. 06-470-2]OZC64559.1 CoA ester lyase [Rhodococcus sp. 06-469-3-2]OZC88422.1 CoA ester lyase [Rhodococcus sp. 06-418-1B]OZD51193.1 CoA ester lyase [Rhodococcus sp. 06-1477-1A]OZE32251.1 CoA ester lyase [Rhodococcus sp. 05-2254-5]OZE58179.1 CoA ester lyase [Rhodococcus sp. 05-2221-1B]OZE59675.1 CoA ester lyase [Rhodococcus sp. 05-2254-1]OZE71632.1 CoA ester lyase [Rhodococcus sp. 15-725-2-2b]OZE86335.1 CoA ester lyase [Rhodococcus sp. 15-649-1-2]